jgi:hypothetical protein
MQPASKTTSAMFRKMFLFGFKPYLFAGSKDETRQKINDQNEI